MAEYRQERPTAVSVVPSHFQAITGDAAPARLAPELKRHMADVTRSGFVSSSAFNVVLCLPGALSADVQYFTPNTRQRFVDDINHSRDG